MTAYVNWVWLLGCLLLCEGALAQYALTTNVVSPTLLVVSGYNLGGGELTYAWQHAKHPTRTRQIGVETMVQNLGSYSYEPGGSAVYRLQSARLGITYTQKKYKKEGAPNNLPKGFYWAWALHAGAGFTYRYNVPTFTGIHTLAHFIPRIGGGGGLGYTLRLGALVLEPELRLGVITRPAAPKNHFKNAYFGNLDLLVSHFLFSRIGLHIGFHSTKK